MSETKPEETVDLWGGVDIPIIGLTGEHESGKTMFASTICPPRTLMIDAELSSASYKSFPYANRVDLFQILEQQGKEATPFNAWMLTKELVESADPSKISVIVIDPWNLVQVGYVEWIEQNPEKFGHTKSQYEKASGTKWGDVNNSLLMWLGSHATRINGSIVLINHLGLVWDGGKPTGKQKAKGVGAVRQIASLYLRLDRSPDKKTGVVPKAPVGYISSVLGGKCRLVRPRFDEHGMPVYEVDSKTGKPIACADPILPPRIENCTPAMVKWYIQNPPDYAKLQKSERIPEQTLTSDEKLERRAEIAENVRAAEEAKLTRLEMMRAAGERRAAASQRPAAASPAASQQPATVVAVAAQHEPKTGNTESKGPVAEPEAAEPEKKPVASESNQAPADPVASETESPKQPADMTDAELHALIDEQRKELGVNDDQLSKVLTKYGVSTISELPRDKALTLQGNLWKKLTARDMTKN